MEIQLTASVIIAIEKAMQLAHWSLWVGEGSERKRVPGPCWVNFRFFGKIQGCVIQKTTRVEPIPGEKLGSWGLSRNVRFYHRGVFVANVKLVGNHIDGWKQDSPEDVGVVDRYDNNSFWAVESIRYRDDDHLEWQLIELHPVSTTRLAMS